MNPDNLKVGRKYRRLFVGDERYAKIRKFQWSSKPSGNRVIVDHFWPDGTICNSYNTSLERSWFCKFYESIHVTPDDPHMETDF
jgi:hypothetical protein